MSTENRVQSFDVAVTLATQRIVALTGTANTVGFPEGITRLPIGITNDDVTETNQAISVVGPGAITKLLFNGSVAAGGLVAGDSSGRGIPFAASGTTTSSNAYVGILVGGTVATTGTVANVYVMPGLGS